MIESVINTINDFLLPLGPLGVFMGAIIEEILAPVPSPLVMMSAGFFLLEGPFSITLLRNLVLIVALPYALGVTVGSYLVYYLAYVSGRPVLSKWGRWLGLSWDSVERLQNKFKGTHKDEVVIFGLRAVPLVPSVALAAFCGLIRMNFKKYTLITFFGVFIRGFVFGLIGWQVGGLYYTYALTIARFEKTAFILVVLLVLLYVGYRLLIKRRNRIVGYEKEK